MRVLVAGPLTGCGGLARVSRQTVTGFDPSQFDIATCDTAKDTPEDRSLLQACTSHLRRWGRFIQAIRRHRPHVVHIHTCSYGTFIRTLLDVWTCRIMRRRYVLHVHGGLFAEFMDSLGGVRKRLAIGGLQHAERVLVLGDSWRTQLTQRIAGLRVVVVPNAVEAQPAVAHDAPRGEGILFVGDLSEAKRPEDLLVACAALPSELRERYPLTLIGSGTSERRHRLEALARRLDIERLVHFAGSLPHEAIHERMSRADLLVIPSRAEGMPLALLEAMQASLPVVAMRVGAIPEVVEDGVDAVLVDPGDTVKLAQAMKRLLSDDAARRAMGERARQRAEQSHSVTAFRGKVEIVWRDVASACARSVSLPLPRLASSAFRSIL